MTRIYDIADLSYPPRDMEMAIALIPELGLSTRAQFVARGLLQCRLALGDSLLEAWALILECALRNSSEARRSRAKRF
jgi:hypothetical protein